MGKVLLWGIAALAILIFARVAAHRAATRQAANQERRATPDSAAKRGSRPEPMVRCAHCGIHLPYSEALVINGQTWCGQEHAQLGTSQD